MFNKAQSILVVAAHPDDEMLGCGGTLACFAAQGAKITILLLGEGPYRGKVLLLSNKTPIRMP